MAVLNHFKIGANTERKRAIILETVVNISMNRIRMASACAQLNALCRTLNTLNAFCRMDA